MQINFPDLLTLFVHICCDFIIIFQIDLVIVVYFCLSAFKCFFFTCCSVQCAAQVKEGLPVAERERRQVTGVARIRAHRRCTHSTKLRGCTQTQGDVHNPQQRSHRGCTHSRKLGGAHSPEQRAHSSRDAHTAEELHKAHS